VSPLSFSGATHPESIVLAVIGIAPEGAEGVEAHAFLGVPALVWQVLNLSLFLVLLYVLLKKPVATLLSGIGARRRRGRAKGPVRAAACGRTPGRRRLPPLSNRDRVGGTPRPSRSRDRNGMQALLAQAEADAARVVSRASCPRSRVALREARSSLTSYAGDLSVQVAERMVRDSVTAEDQLRLVREGVHGLQQAGSAGARKA